MRVIIAYEGVSKVPGQIMEKGALKWEDGPIPICEKPNMLEPQIGFASELRREEDGAITAEVPDGIVPEGSSATIYCTGVSADDTRRRDADGNMVITAATIRMVFFDSPGFWSGKPVE